MIRILLTLALFTGTFILQAQSNCKPVLEYVVNTKSGLKLREGPGTNFQVVTYVPAKSTLLACKELSSPATFEGIDGHWRRIKYKNFTGYMFDGFLSEVETLPINPTVYNFKLTQLSIINRVLAQDISKLDSVLIYLNQVARTLGYETIVGPPKKDIDSLFIQEELPVVTETKPEPIPAIEPVETKEYGLLTETANYCGDIRDIDPGLIWYAIHRQGDNFIRSRAEIMVIKSKYALGSGLEFDIVAEGDKEISFLISSNTRLDTNWTVELPFEYFAQNPNKLFPGQLIEIYPYKPVADIHNISLSATGTVVEVGRCPVLENYKINATAEMHDKLMVQDLTPLFSYLGQCGQPEIYWFGDLNEDAYPDIIFVSVGDEGTLFTLLMTDTVNTDVIYRKADEWFNRTCE